MSYDRQKVIDVALAEVNYLEKANQSQLDGKTANAGSANYTKYARDLDALGDFYNGSKQGFAWCDVFVDWCFVQAYGAEAARALLCQPSRSAGAGCCFSAQYFKAQGRFYTGSPQPGDQIFFTYRAGEVSHTGLVYAVDSSRVYTVEGNTSDGVFKRSYSLGDGSIYGYGRPNYGAATAMETPAPATSPTAAKKPSYEYSVQLGLLKQGMQDRQVQAVQQLLIALGINCGPDGADGDFGRNTCEAVKTFQQRCGLLADGEVGGETWARLLRG